MDRGVSRTDPPGRPFVLQWRLHSPAGLVDTWRGFSDTDRFNRALPVKFKYAEVRRDDGYVERQGSIRRFGQELAWTERAFDFQAPSSFRIDRVFHGGPVAQLTAKCRLSLAGATEQAGTDVEYTVMVWASRWWLRPLVALDFLLNVKGRTSRALQRLIGVLAGIEGGYDPPPPTLEHGGIVRMDEALRALPQREVAEQLRQYLLTAPLSEQDRMSPLALARRWGLPADDVIDGFLAATRAGVLRMSWELLCPSCTGPKVTLDELTSLSEQAHCESCDIRYDGSFPESLAASFRPDPAIRDFELPIRCVGSPSRTPHLLAESELDPDQFVDWRLPLGEGGYRIRRLGSLDCAHVEVRAGVGWTELTADVHETGVDPILLQVAPGEVGIHLRNRLDVPVRVVLERRWRPPDTLTAGRLLEHHGALDLLPAQALGPQIGVEVVRAAVLVTEAFRGREAALRAVELHLGEPTRVVRSDRTLIATWEGEFEEAMAAAARLDGARLVCSAVNVGSVTLIKDGAKAVPSGSAVEEGLAALRVALPGRTSLPGESEQAPEVQAAVAEGSGRRLLPGPDIGGRRDFLVQFPERQSGSAPPELMGGTLLPGPADPDLEDLSGVVMEGRYCLSKKLGGGGFGTVYAADDRRHGWDCVVKVLHPDISHDPVQAQRFFNEARACSRLEHPNTVRVLDFGHSEDGRLYLVMERLEGGELEEALARVGSLHPRLLKDVISGVLAGLAAAHEANLVHRDLKPTNVFLLAGAEHTSARADAKVKVIDFGLAVDVFEGDVEEGTVVGTPWYMAPEQFQGQAAGPAADLYAAGLLIYRCLAGRLPFQEDGGLRMVFRRQTSPIPPLDDICPHPLPPGLVAVVTRALHKAPEDRWPSAQEMRTAWLSAFAAAPDEATWRHPRLNTPTFGDMPTASASASPPGLLDGTADVDTDLARAVTPPSAAGLPTPDTPEDPAAGQKTQRYFTPDMSDEFASEDTDIARSPLPPDD